MFGLETFKKRGIPSELKYREYYNQWNKSTPTDVELTLESESKKNFDKLPLICEIRNIEKILLSIYDELVDNFLNESQLVSVQRFNSNQLRILFKKVEKKYFRNKTLKEIV
jgi:hypothetical protein